ncbi:hypothetical protein [Litoribacillus peritrichatus]|uniref:Uncharacterized protein n=1 Tax=Litoribacillus peritrichatus TaxID=718191 RepID=A0ABP7M1P1_9GAMM
MSRLDLKHVRVGNEVFLKTQVLKKLSNEIALMAQHMVDLYASGHDELEVERIDLMIKQRAEVIAQLTGN